jgi:hypothetical protein
MDSGSTRTGRVAQRPSRRSCSDHKQTVNQAAADPLASANTRTRVDPPLGFEHIKVTHGIAVVLPFLVQ